MHFYSTSFNTLRVSIYDTPNLFVKDSVIPEISKRGSHETDYGRTANWKRCALNSDILVNKIKIKNKIILIMLAKTKTTYNYFQYETQIKTKIADLKRNRNNN